MNRTRTKPAEYEKEYDRVYRVKLELQADFLKKAMAHMRSELKGFQDRTRGLKEA